MLAVGQGVRPEQMTVVTYRRSLADTIRKRLVEWDAVDVPEGMDTTSSQSENPFQCWTTNHAAGFLHDFDSADPLAGMADYPQKRRFCQEMGTESEFRSRGSKRAGPSSRNCISMRRTTRSTSESGPVSTRTG